MQERAPLKRWHLRLLLLACAAILLIPVYIKIAGLSYHWKPLDFWVTQLKQGNQKQKAEAREAIQHLGKRAVKPLIGILEKQDSPLKTTILQYGQKFPILYRILRPAWDQDRAYAASALGRLGLLAVDALPALERAAQNTNALYSAEATAAVIKIKGESIQPIIHSLTNTNPQIWGRAAKILGEFGEAARPALPLLCQALHSTNENIKSMAPYALGYLHIDAHQCVPALIESLQNPPAGIGQKYVSLNAIWAMGEFEDEARTAIPLLQKYLTDPDAMVRQSTLGSLKRILPQDQLKTLVPFLVKDANDPDPNLKAAAQVMLREIDPAAAKR